MATVLLSGCGGTPDTPQRQAENNTPVKQQAPELSDIEKIIANYNSNNNPDLVLNELLQLADNFQHQEQCNKTNIIVAKTLPVLNGSTQRLHANLLRLECQLEGILQHKTANSPEQIALLQDWVLQASDTSVDFGNLTQRLNIAKAVLNILNDELEPAIFTLLEAPAINSVLLAYKEPLIWRTLSSLDQNDRRRFVALYPELSMYQQLFEIVTDDVLDDKTRQTEIRKWLLTYEQSNLANNLPEELLQFVQADFSQANSIAVLLPLSGRLANQGDVIKQGILAAYYKRLGSISPSMTDQIPSLVFVDTGSENTMAEGAVNTDYSGFNIVIGPLLKSHITQTEALLANTVTRVHLNQNDQPETSPLATSFALSPEQEAQQLARLMFENQIRNPILVFERNARVERMKDAFLAQWENLVKLDEQAVMPSTVGFTDNKSMRVGITDALGVLQSEKRIKQLSNLTPETIHSVTRNRRDIDAFVVLANPQDVELINPIIESSISLFSNKTIPVYATSYSYNHRQNKNSLRDLRNLVFIDMPFVQPEGQQTELAQTVNKVFNDPPTTFLRLFAFGYDAFNIANNSLQLKLFTQIRQPGLTGELTIDNQSDVNRTLSSIRIDNQDNLQDGD